MPKVKKNSAAANATSANLGFEAKLWQMADALRNNMDAAEYKHVVLGLIFLKYISDAFEEQHAELEAEKAQGADPEDPDEYRAANIFWVPPEARWSHLQGAAPSSRRSAQLVDDAMVAIERDNPSLKGVLPKDYARPGLDKQRLGQLIDLISNIGLGDAASRAKDMLGRVYEYFLSQFASAEGKKGGQFYTPALRRAAAGRDARAVQGPRLRPVLRLRRHVRAVARSSSRRTAASSATSRIYGQESQLHHLAAGQDEPRHPRHRRRRSPTATPSTTTCTPTSRPTTSSPTRRSTISDWGGELLQRRRALAVTACRPRATPTSPGCSTSSTTSRPTGVAGFVLANGSHVVEPVRRGRDPQGHHRGRPGGLHGRAAGPALLLDADPGLPVVPRAQTRRTASSATGAARRCSSTPASSARMVDRVHRELTDDDIASIAGTYHAWRGDKDAGEYADVPGFCKSRDARRDPQARPRAHARPLRRRRGAEDDGEPFEEKMKRLAATLREQQAEAAKLDAAIAANLKELGYGG